MVNKIVLIGYMGVGKSTIGKELAKSANMEFLDLDEIIEKNENQSITELFKSKGELYFRKLEHQIFEALLKNDNQFVLSTGGGTPCYYDNHLLLEDKQVRSVYLDATIDTIYNRLNKEQEKRPIVKDLTSLELKEFIAKHLFERRFYYQKASFKIKVDEKNVEQIVKEINEKLF